jgi:DNA-binding NtrC family response regulator
LRERKEDIPLIVEHFVASLNRELGRKVSAVPKKVMDNLMEYHWPGNIRELSNVVERAYVLSTGSKLDIGSWFNPSKGTSLQDQGILPLQENEMQHILRALKHTKWRIRGKNGAAELLKINPTTLESRMKKLGIERPI